MVSAQFVGERGEIAFVTIAVQYYVAGRQAAIAQLFPVSGNLLHHAVEMLLKGALCRTKSLEELRANRHNLKRSWNAFRASFPEEELAEFTPAVRAPGSASTGLPLFSLVLEDVDALVQSIFCVANINPQYYVLSLSGSAKRSLENHKRHALPAGA